MIGAALKPGQTHRWRGVFITALLVVIALGGCATPSYDALPAEKDLPHLSSLGTAWRKLHRRTHFIRTLDADGLHPIDVAIHTVGDGNKPRTMVMLHGVLSDHETWRFIAPTLAEHYNLIMVDMPGSGASDAPAPKNLGPDAYSIPDLAWRVGSAVTKIVKDRPETPILWIAHSLGGAVTMRLFSYPMMADFDVVAQRVDKLTLIAPFDIQVARPDAAILNIIEVSGLKVAVGDFLGLLKEEFGRLTLESGERGLVPREEASRIVRLFRDPARRIAAQTMLHRAVPWIEDRRPDWDRIEPVVRAYGTIPYPTLILWGSRDETLPLATGYKLRDEIPDAVLHVIAQSKHSLQIERPQIVLQAIRRFLVRGTNGAPVSTITPHPNQNLPGSENASWSGTNQSGPLSN